MKGWCPVHDRVFDAPGTDCPECGAALVAVDDETPGDDETAVVAIEAEPKRAVPAPASASEAAKVSPLLRPSTLAIIVVAAIVSAFLLGLDASGPNAPSLPRFGTPEATAELSVGQFSRGVAGVTLRLESFSQRGRRIVMRVTVPPDQPIPTGSIQTAQVEFFGPGGSSAGIAAELPVRVTTTGFIIDGVALERADIPIAAAQIDGLTLSAPAEALLPVNLSGVWPPDRDGGPQAKTVSETVRVGSRTFTLKALVGWPDRIEARLQIRGYRPEWFYDDEFALLIGKVERRPGSVLATFEENPGLVHVVFDGPRLLGGAPGILIDHSRLQISGQWRWDLGPR